MVIDDTGSVEAFMPLYIAQSGDLDRCYRCLTDSLTTLKDRATQLLTQCKSRALATQFWRIKMIYGKMLTIHNLRMIGHLFGNFIWWGDVSLIWGHFHFRLSNPSTNLRIC